MKNVGKYLQKYAEPFARLSIELPFVFDNVVVIPAFDEGQAFLEQKNFAQGGSNLVIVVVNAPEQEVDQSRLDRTKLLLEYIYKEMIILWKNDLGMALLKNEKIGYSLFVVDCVSIGRRIPDKMGVGMARKIGADIAVNLIYSAQIRSRTIFSTDADVQIPDGYLKSIDGPDLRISGYTFPFSHNPDYGFDMAMQLYEFSLHYYVVGLKYAGSGYAFHTIGSCLAFDVEAYAKVRGFPKRAAGEDFYLLNKLAKVGVIKSLARPVVKIAGRGSDRVPFGTGPAITKIAGLESPLEQYRFYNPAVFKCLKIFLQSLWRYWKTNGSDVVFNEYNEQIVGALRGIGFYSVLYKLRGQAKSQEQFLRASYDWFDAFKTLKFIHYLRDNFFSSVLIGELHGGEFVSELVKQYPALFKHELAVQ